MNNTRHSSALARELRADLARRQMTQIDLARRSGLSRQTIGRLLAGSTSISIDHYVIVVAALNTGDQREVVGALIGEMRMHARRGALMEGAEAAVEAAEAEPTA